jgi:antitoxin component HigA of HigAB toxin-antitoxin module
VSRVILETDCGRTTKEDAMHLLDPARLHTDTQYCAALDELEKLLLADPDTPAGRRFDELVALIEEYEATHESPPDWPLPQVARAA